MSLSVNQLTKIYGAQRALNNISFTVNEGEILGFLGPNGAGKSTTFKVSTGLVPPTEGSVQVAGFSVTEQPLEVKKLIGYLPEHNPLYLDMFVHEYLQFMGSLHGLSGSQLKKKVGEMVEKCGLVREQNKKIETLSKGYRQRVGLAQALLHDPKVLLLDEPTSGLDPNQLVEIRKLIKEVSHNKTVIFSTHIMQEVEALCERVVIINKGEIVTDALLKDLLTKKDNSVCTVEFEGEVEESLLTTIEGINQVRRISKPGERTIKFSIESKPGVDVRSALFRIAADKNLSLLSLKQEQQNLEHIFQELTKQTTEA
ncbi:MAG: gliding motility-associated ABC transporter ATP-binding subunit GldA [Cytophagia bacterium]|nr:gliding motility-associated ABC transporter ATP-binding subunit GldA [Cytophagia bacterium]